MNNNLNNYDVKILLIDNVFLELKIIFIKDLEFVFIVVEDR